MKDPVLVRLARVEPRRDYHAYEFVCEATCEVQEMLERTADDRHITPAELIQGAAVVAVAKWGMLAPLMLRWWGIHGSHEFGDITMRLIEAEILMGNNDHFSDFLAVDINDELRLELDAERRRYTPTKEIR